MVRRDILALAGLALVFAARTATAHAFLAHALPAVGSTLDVAPKEIRIWFTSAVEPAFSTIEVKDAGGKSVTQGKTEADAADQTVLHVTLGPLAPGTYTVTWRATSVDTHKTEGSFEFHLAG
jgi:copper resistance protein C